MIWYIIDTVSRVRSKYRQSRTFKKIAASAAERRIIMLDEIISVADKTAKEEMTVTKGFAFIIVVASFILGLILGIACTSGCRNGCDDDDDFDAEEYLKNLDLDAE